MKALLSICLALIGAASATAPNTGGRPILRKSLPDGQTLIVRRERVSNIASPESVKRLETSTGMKIAVDENIFWFHFLLVDKSGSEERLWSKPAPDNPLSPGGMDVLDVALERRVLIVVFRAGTTVHAEVLECHSGALPKRRVSPPAIFQELFAHVRTAAISGSLGDGTLRVRLTATANDGDRTFEFALLAGTHGPQWVAREAAPLPASRPATTRSTR